ncbi:MAG TPA: hypothetical protein VGE98_08140, partial [Thermoanaerobaculia bacterium]
SNRASGRCAPIRGSRGSRRACVQAVRRRSQLEGAWATHAIAPDLVAVPVSGDTLFRSEREVIVKTMTVCVCLALGVLFFAATPSWAWGPVTCSNCALVCISNPNPDTGFLMCYSTCHAVSGVCPDCWEDCTSNNDYCQGRVYCQYAMMWQPGDLSRPAVDDLRKLRENLCKAG